MKTITSIQNNYIKNLVKLQEKSRERKKQQLFLIEGVREITIAIKGNYNIETLLVASNILSKNDDEITMLIEKHNTIEVSNEVYEKLAYRDSTEGIIAVVKTKKYGLDELKFETASPLILIMEGIEKPGNVGAMLRTADAANVDAVIIANSKTDIYNPNVIRSSVGCLFTNQIAIASTDDVITYLKQKNINIYSATLQNSNKYYEEDYTKPSAIVVGTEATGLSERWRTEATQNINIPMEGVIDSMNVSVAAAIVIFEAKRQRISN
ncbi:TrmH family RNA methyltransferase [Tenacibaculum sp. M341]|uniref:TrmH family RNA methyltransferase n=1 Tax=Tenacibaculum sp. M341 TaxID=2530339 RepID=UPI00104548DB|nr:RNA methyltransferase [Tenacibaculum sp. M341]TCI94813.1 RNA methyltransferase [Tenacibaculum sp. M341]